MTADDYTPTRLAMRQAYFNSRGFQGSPVEVAMLNGEFDRFLAAHDAEVLAAADRVPVTPDRDKLARWMKKRFAYGTFTHWRWQADMLLASSVFVPAVHERRSYPKESA